MAVEFTASGEEVGFQTLPEAEHANPCSSTAIFVPWRTLGKHPCQKGSSPM